MHRIYIHGDEDLQKLIKEYANTVFNLNEKDVFNLTDLDIRQQKYFNSYNPLLLNVIFNIERYI